MAYLIAGLASTVLHLGVIAYVLFAPSEAGLSLGSLYYPDNKPVQRGSDNILTAGALLFFQWDYIVLNLTVVSHGVFILGQHHPIGPRHPFFRLLAISVLLGPGAALAYSLWCEETRLESNHHEQSRSEPFGVAYGTMWSQTRCTRRINVTGD
jgi:hypothetical protein